MLGTRPSSIRERQTHTVVDHNTPELSDVEARISGDVPDLTHDLLHIPVWRYSGVLFL